MRSLRFALVLFAAFALGRAAAPHAAAAWDCDWNSAGWRLELVEVRVMSGGGDVEEMEAWFGETAWVGETEEPIFDSAETSGGSWGTPLLSFRSEDGTQHTVPL